MKFTTLKVAGDDAVEALNSCRAAYRNTGDYPFLIGDAEDLERIQEAAEIYDEDLSGQPLDEILAASASIDLDAWIRNRIKEAEEYEFSAAETLGEWPGSIEEKGSIGLHRDVLTQKVKPEVFIGIAAIKEPWHLPAVLKYGAWNDCPEPALHCAMHRNWLAQFGAEITGMSGDVVECTVARPPRTRDAAVALAWQQYWYCTDIVDQGCGSVSNLAATLLDSPYWYFWWD